MVGVTGLASRISIAPPRVLPCQPGPGSILRRRRLSVVGASSSPSDDAGTNQGGGDPAQGEDLAAKLAAAEAEAEALRRELEQRKAAEAYGAPRRSARKIDGVGYRETIFERSNTRGEVAKKPGLGRDWGFTEAELLQAEGGRAALEKEFGLDSDDNPVGKVEADAIVQRRLLIGGGLAVVGLALAFIDIPVTVAPPSKPLYVYLTPLVRLEAELRVVLDQAEFLDALGLRSQLKLATGSLSAVKGNLLNVVGSLNSDEQATAKSLAFEILGYLEQADYSKYFEGVGVPGPYQQTEYIKFSTQSVEVALRKLNQFFSVVPSEPLRFARRQYEGEGAIPEQ